MIAVLTRLLRVPLSLMNGIAALGGYCLFPGTRSGLGLLAACGGVTLLAMGGSALNQVMERDLDALMKRTMDRPLPRGDLQPLTAATVGCLVIIAGLIVIAMAGSMVAVLFGLLSLVWYLAVYTPLKQRTSLALPLGALCGAVPPLIGWCLAGGAPSDFPIIILAGILYLWQVPHFWLLQARHADDYRRAGILLFVIRPGHFGLWLVALTSTSLMLPAFGIIGHHAAYWYGIFLSILFVTGMSRREHSLFSYLNLFPVLVTLTLLIQG
jgi:protoheme IX farnesyltransferase